MKVWLQTIKAIMTKNWKDLGLWYNFINRKQTGRSATQPITDKDSDLNWEEIFSDSSVDEKEEIVDLSQVGRYINDWGGS